MSKNVFILSKNPISSEKLEVHLREQGYVSECHVNLSTLLKAEGIDSAMSVIVDKLAEDNEAEDWVSQLRMQFPRLCLLLMISNTENHLLNNYMKAGVTDIIHKPWHPVTVTLRLKVYETKAKNSLPTQNERLVSSDVSEPIKHAS